MKKQYAMWMQVVDANTGNAIERQGFDRLTDAAEWLNTAYGKEWEAQTIKVEIFYN